MPTLVAPAVMSAAATRQLSTARPPGARCRKELAAHCPQTAAQNLRHSKLSHEGDKLDPKCLLNRSGQLSKIAGCLSPDGPKRGITARSAARSAARCFGVHVLGPGYRTSRRFRTQSCHDRTGVCWSGPRLIICLSWHSGGRRQDWYPIPGSSFRIEPHRKGMADLSARQPASCGSENEAQPSRCFRRRAHRPWRRISCQEPLPPSSATGTDLSRL